MVFKSMSRLIKRYTNTKNERNNLRRNRQFSGQERNDVKCFECGKYGHIQAKCLDMKRKATRGF